MEDNDIAEDQPEVPAKKKKKKERSEKQEEETVEELAEDALPPKCGKNKRFLSKLQ